MGCGETNTGQRDTECGTSEYLCLGKCAFHIKALDFAVGHSGGYTLLGFARENVSLIIIKDLASRPLVCGTPTEGDGICTDSQQTVNRWGNGSTLEGNVGWGIQRDTKGYSVRNC